MCCHRHSIHMQLWRSNTLLTWVTAMCNVGLKIVKSLTVCSSYSLWCPAASGKIYVCTCMYACMCIRALLWPLWCGWCSVHRWPCKGWSCYWLWKEKVSNVHLISLFTSQQRNRLEHAVWSCTLMDTHWILSARCNVQFKAVFIQCCCRGHSERPTQVL